jgi:cardiolipin-specific phospholipase
LRGSGEYALAYLLAPGAYARRPLIQRVKKLQHDTVLKKVTWIYGSYDWMDVDAGKEASEGLGDIETDLIVVDKAGHNVHLDNPVEFNRIMLEELRT